MKRKITPLDQAVGNVFDKKVKTMDGYEDDDDDGDDMSGSSEDEETEAPAGRQGTASVAPPGDGDALSRHNLYRPPTSAELNELKETETLFHSSLFRMQVSELLAEVTLKTQRRKMADQFIGRLKVVLTSLPAGDKYQLTDQSWLQSVRIPIMQQPAEVKGQFQFLPPENVKVIGSYAVDTATKTDLHIDVSVEMPRGCIQAKDYLNQRYVRKRALYLAAIAGHLVGRSELVGEVNYAYHHDNRMKPLLILRPAAGDQAHKLAVRLHVCPAPGAFKLNRFHVHKSNIRTSWWQQTSGDDAVDGCGRPTPLYNTLILSDLTTENSGRLVSETLRDAAGVRDGVLLLKVWLHQRQLDVGRGCFSGFIMTMLVSYLVSKRTISKLMSSYQVLRNMLAYLTEADWSSRPISLANEADDPTRPTLAEMQRAFDVVFVDTTGYVNLCAEMSKETFQLMKHEAKLGLQFLETPGLDSFQSLFMTPLLFLRRFDQSFSIADSSWMEKVIEKNQLDASLADNCGDSAATCLPKVVAVLQRAIGKRLQLLAVKPVTTLPWGVTSERPSLRTEPMTFGLLLQADTANSILDKGPPADSPEAAEFREFWGAKSELRRFQDGAICEAVVWPAEVVSERRRVVHQVVKHVLHRHCAVLPGAVRCAGAKLDALLLLPQRVGYNKGVACGTGEEHQVAAVRCYDALCAQLRSLSDLPLTITSLVATSPTFRAAEVFPPMPATFGCDAQKRGDRLLPHPKRTCPPWTPALNVRCLLEGSGAWPDDLEAVRRVKAAFHVTLAQALRGLGLLVRCTTSHVDILKMGYVFRLRVGHKREIGLLKMVRSHDGMVKMVDTERSREMEEQLVLLPKLTTALNSIHQTYSSYSGAVRLAKRWLSSQMLLQDYFREEAVELVVAHLYLCAAPYLPPGSPLVGFVRFLHLMATHDWQRAPLVINFNGDMKKPDYTAVEERFRDDRASLPVMFIATPYDGLTSSWTRHAPSAPVLHRVAVLAAKSRDVLEAQMMPESIASANFHQIFRPSMSIYDVVIELEDRQSSRAYYAVDLRPATFVPSHRPYDPETSPQPAMPVVNYDPVQLYLRELRESYNETALFFHDIYGGCNIGVLWRPQAFKPRPFKVSDVHGRMPTSHQGALMVPNVERFIDDIRVAGEGLVKNVRVMSEKWKV